MAVGPPARGGATEPVVRATFGGRGTRLAGEWRVEWARRLDLEPFAEEAERRWPRLERLIYNYIPSDSINTFQEGLP